MPITNLIKKPTLLLDQTRAIRNIERMAAKAARSNVRFRPHFKTHQSAEIGDWFRRFGVSAITVSSVDMARAFARHGWDDITIAFPANLRQLDELDALAGAIHLGLLVESTDVVQRLAGALNNPVDAWIKIDVGTHRTGLAWDDPAAIQRVGRAVAGAPRLNLRGVLTHDSRGYRARSKETILNTLEEGITRMQAARQALRDAGLEAEISIGDTPGSSVTEAFSGVDEIRPGNFVFYDVQQWQIGACREEEIAVALACPVVAKHPSRNQLVLYGGAVHLSKDHALRPEESRDGRPSYGRVARLTDDGWGPILPDATVTSLSQEHGIVQTTPDLYNTITIGDLLAILPAHSCLTANLMGRYLTLDGQWIEMTR